MGYQRQKFEREQRALIASRPDRDAPTHNDAPDKQTEPHGFDKLKSPRSFVRDLLLVEIRKLAPPSNEPGAKELGTFIKQYASSFQARHFVEVLQVLADDCNISPEHLRGRKTVALDLISSLEEFRGKFSMKENAQMLKVLAQLEIHIPRVVEPFISQATKQCRYYSIAEISQCMKALPRLQETHLDLSKLLRGILRRATEIFDTIDNDSVIHIAEHLSECRTKHSAFNSLLTERLLQGDCHLSLHDMGKLSRALALNNSFSAELHPVFSERVNWAASPKASTPLSFTDARGLARTIRALEMSGWRCSISTMCDLRDAIQDHWKSYDKEQQIRLTRDLAPILAVRDLPIPAEMLPCATEYLWVPRHPLSLVSKFESSVGATLNHLGVHCECSTRMLGFELDFLVTTRAGRLVNVEADGDVCHMVVDLSATRKDQPERLIEDTFRDLALTKSGIHVVRVLRSQWIALSEQERGELLKQLIPDLR